MQIQPWTEKYRPLSLSDVVAHELIIEIINRFASSGSLPHLLFHGPPGTGKTSTVLALAKKLFGTSFTHMVLELNASDARGIDVVRDEIQSFSSTSRPATGRFKLVIMDECDSMTKDAQFALRRIMERYTRHTRFCLIGNYASKIIPALQSRCTKFRFAPINPALVNQRLRYIASEENIKATQGSLEAIQRLGNGDMRKTLNIFQSVSLASKGNVEEEIVYATTGQLHMEDISLLLTCMLEQKFEASFSALHTLKRKRGFAIADVIGLLSEAVLRLHLTSSVRTELLLGLAEIEYALTFTGLEKIQMLSLVSIFTAARGIYVH